jgi:adenylate cyclase
MSVSLAEPGARGGVTVAEVTLSSLWEAVVRIKIGKTGWTYVVDGQGKLLAHPFRQDLQQTDVSGSPQVRKALSGPAGPSDALIEPIPGPRLQTSTEPSATAAQVITSWAGVPATGWLVFVEQPVEEAFAPIYAAVARTILLLLLGLVLATLASLLLARRMVAPIRELQAGAVRIGAGDLQQRIEVGSGDELEALADEFNAMSNRLRESYATLEQRIEERTRERNALSDVSQAIGSTLDVEQVLTRVVEHAVQFSVADAGAIYAYDESTQKFLLRATLHFGGDLNDGLRLEPPQLGVGAVGQAGQERAIVQIPDIQVEGTYHGPLRERLLAAGFRSLLALPLLAEERLQGALVVARKTPGVFAAEAVALLRTFASQSALPIQNARLYQEKIELNHTLDVRVQQQVGELERVRRLERYFSPQVAELILSGEASLEQKNRREVTVVFCDLRGYTAFSNRAPEYVIDVLNEYHRALGELIWTYEGTLERFAGDGLMVFFNDPVQCENPHERAVRMAIEMRDRMGLLTERWRYEEEAELGFGVGIDHGYASTGRIGFEGRFDYAAIGEPTNRAARLCAEAGNDQILISQRVYARVDQLVDAELIGLLDLKGFPEPVRTYNVLGLAQSTPSAPRF